MRIYTRKGDDGTTGLLYGGDRVSKADLRTEAYGSTDEAVSALGLARAAIGAITDRTEARLDPLILRLQRELFVVGAELATHADRRDRLTPGTTLVTSEMVTALEGEIDALEADQEMPAEFVLPGESMTGAALDLARSTVRRAERKEVPVKPWYALRFQMVGRLAPTSLRQPFKISRVPAMPPTYAFFSRQRTRKPRFASSAVAARPLWPAPTTMTS